MADIRGRVGYTILLLHLALPGPAAAQERPAPARPVLAWASAGIGAGTQGFAGMVGADLLVGHNVISARAAFVDQLFEDGFYGFANFNGEQSFAGATLTVDLGRLR